MEMREIRIGLDEANDSSSLAREHAGKNRAVLA
jgi:hypothetical protein